MVIYGNNWWLMITHVVRQCHKPPMTGNGKDTTYKNAEIWDGLLLFYTHYIILRYFCQGTS
jgi:hypothetical protein